MHRAEARPVAFDGGAMGLQLDGCSGRRPTVVPDGVPPLGAPAADRDQPAERPEQQEHRLAQDHGDCSGTGKAEQRGQQPAGGFGTSRAGSGCGEGRWLPFGY